MTPEQKQALSGEFNEALLEKANKAMPLLFTLQFNYILLKNTHKLTDLKDSLDEVIEDLDGVLNRMNEMLKLLTQDMLDQEADTLKQEIKDLLADYEHHYPIAEAENKKAVAAAKEKPEVDLSSIQFIDQCVNLNSYPQKRPSYGQFNHMVPKLGDGHACVPKILYFALAAGVAKMLPKARETPEKLYDDIIQTCAFVSNAQKLKLIEKQFEQVQFHENARLLLLGDLFMDRNGNDMTTALFLKRIDECKARVMINISNHDRQFLFWILNGMPNMRFMKDCGQSSVEFKFLVDNGITTLDKIIDLLEKGYFKKLIAIYYEIAPNKMVTNIGTHAPTGEWEIYEIAQGLYNYSRMPENAQLFTEGQIKRLLALSSLEYDAEYGLSSYILKIIIDLINEIVHTNALKPDKTYLYKLFNLGFLQLTSAQCNGQGINPRVSPLYWLMWNRDSPRAAPSKGEPRLFFNGHDVADALLCEGKPWVHNNVSLDDYAGKGLDMMNNEDMRYALPVNGYTPMPDIDASSATAVPVVKASVSSRGRTYVSNTSSDGRDRSPPSSFRGVKK